MIVSEAVLETYACVVDHGPISAKDISARTDTPLSTVRDRLRSMVAEEYVEYVSDEFERIYIVGATPIDRAVVRRTAPSRPKELIPRQENTAAMRERVHALALDAGLDVRVAATAGFRLSVPHPFATGRVWLDTPGDLEAVLIEMVLGRQEEWHAAA